MSKLDDLKRLGEQKRLAAVEKAVQAETKRKNGRPLAKDADKTLAATKPWEKEGVSRRTWYRRLKETK